MRFLSICAAALTLAATAFAQEAPNRIIVNNNIEGHRKVFATDFVKDITFDRIDGEVSVNISDIKDFKVEGNVVTSFTVSMIRSMSCSYFRIGVLGTPFSSQLFGNDELAIDWLDSNGVLADAQLTEDFNGGTLSGVELPLGADYTIWAVAYDDLGCAAGVSHLSFSTPKPQLVGDPKVEATFSDQTLNSFVITVTPNSDVKQWYMACSDKGGMVPNYNQFGPMFGCASMSQYIKRLSGDNHKGKEVYTNKGMNPNTEYEVYIVCEDAKGNLTDPQIFYTSTLKQGGSGEAITAQTFTKYEITNWGTEDEPKMLPSLFVKYTPNDQTWRYHFNVYTKEIFDAHADEIRKEMLSIPEQGTVYYWWYKEFETDYQVNANTQIVAVCASQNADGKFGTLQEVGYTTPAQAGEPMTVDYVKTYTIPAPRAMQQPVNFNEPGRAIKMAKPRKLTLTQK